MSKFEAFKTLDKKTLFNLQQINFPQSVIFAEYPLTYLRELGFRVPTGKKTYENYLVAKSCYNSRFNLLEDIIENKPVFINNYAYYNGNSVIKDFVTKIEEGILTFNEFRRLSRKSNGNFILTEGEYYFLLFSLRKLGLQGRIYKSFLEKLIDGYSKEKKNETNNL